MVVMDYLDPTVYTRLLPSLLPNLMLLEEIRQAVQILHSEGFVHGDVRGPNMMACHTGAGGSNVMLVNFDWAGREGDVRYPPNIDPHSCPIGVEDGQTIKKEHDEEMVTLIFRYCVDSPTIMPAFSNVPVPRPKGHRPSQFACLSFALLIPSLACPFVSLQLTCTR